MLIAARAPVSADAYSSFSRWAERLLASVDRTRQNCAAQTRAFLASELSRAANARLYVARTAAPARVSPAAKPVAIARPQPVARAMTREEQFARLARVVESALESGREAASCHATAGRQLDLAQYGLSTLLKELRDVMALPERPAAATLHPIVPTPRQPARQDAIAA